MKKIIFSIVALSALQVAFASEIDLMPRTYTLTFTDSGGAKTFTSSIDDLNDFGISNTQLNVLSCYTEKGSAITVEYYGQNFTLTHGSTTKYWFRYNNTGSSNNFGTFDGITNCTLSISGHAFQRILNNTRYQIQVDYGSGYHTILLILTAEKILRLST